MLNVLCVKHNGDRKQGHSLIDTQRIINQFWLQFCLIQVSENPAEWSIFKCELQNWSMKVFLFKIYHSFKTSRGQNAVTELARVPVWAENGRRTLDTYSASVVTAVAVIWEFLFVPLWLIKGQASAAWKLIMLSTVTNSVLMWMSVCNVKTTDQHFDIRYSQNWVCYQQRPRLGSESWHSLSSKLHLVVVCADSMVALHIEWSNIPLCAVPNLWFVGNPRRINAALNA